MSRVTRLQSEIIKFCVHPKTVREVANHFEHSYHTAYKHMKFLEQQRALVETLGIRDKASLWQTSPEFMQNQWFFSTERRAYQPVEFLNMLAAKDDKNKLQVISNAIAEMMAITYVHDLERSKGEEIAGLPDSSEDALKVVIFLKEQLDMFVGMIGQLISAPIWDGTSPTWLKDLEGEPQLVKELADKAHYTYLKFKGEING